MTILPIRHWSSTECARLRPFARRDTSVLGLFLKRNNLKGEMAGNELRQKGTTKNMKIESVDRDGKDYLCGSVQTVWNGRIIMKTTVNLVLVVFRKKVKAAFAFATVCELCRPQVNFVLSKINAESATQTTAGSKPHCQPALKKKVGESMAKTKDASVFSLH